MTQRSPTRDRPKTKAELREMLAEAVRNTQYSAGHRPKAKEGPVRPSRFAVIVSGHLKLSSARWMPAKYRDVLRGAARRSHGHILNRVW
jgi:hypothetical protein